MPREAHHPAVARLTAGPGKRVAGGFRRVRQLPPSTERRFISLRPEVDLRLALTNRWGQRGGRIPVGRNRRDEQVCFRRAARRRNHDGCGRPSDFRLRELLKSDLSGSEFHREQCRKQPQAENPVHPSFTPRSESRPPRHLLERPPHVWRNRSTFLQHNAALPTNGSWRSV